jgi:hypothetical protein
MKRITAALLSCAAALTVATAAAPAAAIGAVRSAPSGLTTTVAGLPFCC